MKILLLITAAFLTGCASLPSILKNDLTACLEAQKAISRDQTMAEIARYNAIQEIVKNNANEQTKMSALSQINNKPQQNLTCK
jgi:starvation-inducible outer membrane lipoprotein